MADPSIVRFRAVVQAALLALEAHREEVNELNVFPVPDHDTGDNMVLTLRALVQELDRLATASEQSAMGHIDRAEIVAYVARAALLGARGSSGVILSQFIRGAAEELASRPGELVDPVLICSAMARATDQAYGSVRAPAEGTMLTVVREMTARMASELAHMGEARLPPDAGAVEQNAVIAELVERALEAGRESVKRGPALLDALREAGVVDAGGYGLVVMISGIAAALRGAAPAEHRQSLETARASHPQHTSSGYRYCTNFAVTGSDLDARSYIAELERLGDAVLVVGDPQTLKVHVHTDDPHAATALFEGAGKVSHLDIADMRAAARPDEQPAARRSGRELSGLVAVASGAGIRALFESFGARVVEDGKVPHGTASATTYDLLAAIHATGAEQVVVLPNGPGALEAARQAAQLSDKTVVVVESRSHQAGLAAAAVLDPSRDARENAELMTKTLARVTTGSVARAAADDPDGRFRAGEAVGFVDREPIAWGQPRDALRAVLEQLAHGAELITCLRGADAPLDDRTVQKLAAGEVEFELSEGGQHEAWWLLAAE
jgi:uncharacterized protein